MKGKVVKKVDDKGFGFIAPDGGGKDVFFHVSGMANREDFDALQPDDPVEYDVDHDHDRPRAKNVRRE